MTATIALAEIVGLPGVPETLPALRRRARADGWRAEGGAVAVEDLPAETRSALAARQVAPIGAAGMAARLAPLSETAERRAAARAAIVQAWRQFAGQALLSPSTAAEPFCRAYNLGAITVEAWVRADVDHVCARSLLAWARASAREGFGRLAGRYGAHRKGTGTIDSDPAIRELVTGLLAGSPHCDAAQVMRALEARFGPGSEAPRTLPSYRSLRRWIAAWRADNPGLLLSLINPDAHRSRLRVAFGSASQAVAGLNDLWELDTTPQDVRTTDGRRNALIGIIDVWSRRAMILVAPTSSGLSVTAALRRAILAWGVPARIKTDNGKDYVSRHVVRALVDLGIEHTISPPYTPEAKPHIERWLQTQAFQFLELLPGYIGHNVEQQQAIRAQRSFAERREQDAPAEVALSAADLQARLDDWCDLVYARTRHRSLGRSPFERAAAWTGAIRRIADERALDVLLAEAPDNGGIRRVTKKGVAVEGGIFIAAELGPLVGEDVRVRYDPADMGRIWVFDGDGRFVCVAWCPDRTGIDRAAVAAEAKHRQAAAVSAARKELKAVARRVKAADIAAELIAAGRRRAGQVVALPRKADPHQTPAIEQAGLAARVDDAQVPLPLTEAQRRLAAHAQSPARTRQSDIEMAAARFARALSIEAAIGRGEMPGEDDLRWLQMYRSSAEYRARRRIAAVG